RLKERQHQLNEARCLRNLWDHDCLTEGVVNVCVYRLAISRFIIFFLRLPFFQKRQKPFSATLFKPQQIDHDKNGHPNA
ncbi:MAG: hypothetical protein ABN490_07715, partial [Pantoea agglomerans]